jgi:ABC-type lipoprotein export system ATPase subunit
MMSEKESNHNQVNPLIFKIDHLRCSYTTKNQGRKDHHGKHPTGQDPVLVIDQLEIPRGKLTAIVGVSGSGKSTFLETIGLMNNTIIQDKPSLMFYPLTSDKSGNIEYDLSDSKLWRQKGNGHIETIRKKYFSFIFQNTNLMPNFTVFENVLISDLIINTPYAQAYVTSLIFLDKLKLSYLPVRHSPVNISGGEKQRVAFARAIVPDFEVLFGDEPTGNLDATTADEVMAILKNYINSNQKSAIIVTHDLNLATKFADLIMVLTKRRDVSKMDDKCIIEFGEIKQEHVFKRESPAQNIAFNSKDELDKLLKESGIVKKDIEAILHKNGNLTIGKVLEILNTKKFNNQLTQFINNNHSNGKQEDLWVNYYPETLKPGEPEKKTSHDLKNSIFSMFRSSKL